MNLAPALIATKTGIDEIAAECFRRLKGFNRKIVFLIPKTEQRKQVANLFMSGMGGKGFNVKQFCECDAAMEWLLDSTAASN